MNDKEANEQISRMVAEELEDMFRAMKPGLSPEFKVVLHDDLVLPEDIEDFLKHVAIVARRCRSRWLGWFWRWRYRESEVK